MTNERSWEYHLQTEVVPEVQTNFGRLSVGRRGSGGSRGRRPRGRREVEDIVLLAPGGAVLAEVEAFVGRQAEVQAIVYRQVGRLVGADGAGASLMLLLVETC